jgi:hypothetical protein
MWFLVVAILSGPVGDRDALAQAMAAGRYETSAECYADAPRRLGGLAAMGVHGTALCMKHAESNKALRRSKRVGF